MKLYHGSKTKLNHLEPRQAQKADYIDVPENELLKAIYLTPHYDFALACAARPEGVTTIDQKNKKITFEDPTLFGPEREVFVYEIEIDLESIPQENIEIGEDDQYIIKNFSELTIDNRFTHQARDIQKYYELTNWQEKPREISHQFNLR